MCDAGGPGPGPRAGQRRGAYIVGMCICTTREAPNGAKALSKADPNWSRHPAHKPDYHTQTTIVPKLSLQNAKTQQRPNVWCETA